MLVLICLPLVSMYWRSGGMLHPESAAFILNYLADRPLLNKIFDPLYNDWGFYQARELSYLVDWLDVQFIAICAKWKLGHFYSLSFTIITLLIVAVQQYFGNKIFRNLTRTELWAISLLMLSTPLFLLNNSFYRSSKPLCAVLITVMCYLTLQLYYFAISGNRGKSDFTIGAVIAAELLLVFADRQGIFMAAVFTMALALLLLSGALFSVSSKENSHIQRCLAVGSGAVVLAGALYNRMICPAAISALNHYHPDFSFQQLPPVTWNSSIGGIAFCLESLGLLIGWSSVTGGLVTIGVILLLLIPYPDGHPFSWNRRQCRQQVYFTAVFVLLLLAACVMFILMVTRHPLMSLLPEIVLGGYAMPVMVMIVFFFMLGLNWWQGSRRRLPHWLVISVLLGIGCLNLSMIPRHMAVEQQGQLRRQFIVSPQILHHINATVDDRNYELLTPAEITLIRRLRNSD